jgi:predicted 3-demethylubiquinone-9 3-methyltransferase (glyoxalase superfamily)
MHTIQQKITLFLAFDGKAEEAAAHYTSIFPGSRIVSTMPGPDGSVLGVTFELSGQTFIALNGGPSFTFSNGMSLFVSCDTQGEVDAYWDKLLAGGKPLKCGWLVDKYGIAWQIVPRALGRLLSDADRARAGRAMQAMLGMVKLDVAGLERAADEAVSAEA